MPAMLPVSQALGLNTSMLQYNDLLLLHLLLLHFNNLATYMPAPV